jgi:hypothetical protein
MASPEAYRHFLSLGYPVDQCPYNRYDLLESNSDLEALYEVLDSVKDINRRPAILTANSLVANPDFEKIQADNFTNYYYELLTDTLRRYPNHDRVFELYHQGIENKLIKPQFHGREHLNIGRWMKALQDNDQFAKEAFRFRMFSVHPDKINDNGLEYMEALDYDDEAQLKSFNDILVDGAGIFKQLWGYTSTTFIASCYIWPEEVEPMLSQTGVKYLQGTVYKPFQGLTSGLNILISTTSWGSETSLVKGIWSGMHFLSQVIRRILIMSESALKGFLLLLNGINRPLSVHIV